MEMLFKKPIAAVSVLMLICGGLFFLQLGKLSLTDPDETFYAQTAKEMLSKNEWITPHLYGKPQFEKPILFYWLVEASFKAFGVNELAARLPSAVFATAGVIAIFFLGTLFFSQRAGFLSALILATNVEYIVLSRACITDMALFMFMLLALLFFSMGYLREKSHYYLLSSASIALAVLTKGPVYLILFAAAILAFLFFIKDLRLLKRVPLWQSALIFVAVTLPWYSAIYHIHGKAFVDGFFGFHNVNRFLVSEHKIGSQVYYNIPIMFGGMFPWSIFLPVGFWHTLKKAQNSKVKTQSSILRQSIKAQNEGKGSALLLVWFFVIFGFFTASSTKLPTYIFPCFISLAVITGVLLDDFLKRDMAPSIDKSAKASYYLLILIMLLGWLGGAIYAKLDYPVILAGVVASGLVIAFGGLLSLILFVNKKYAPAFAFIAYSVAASLFPLSALILPDIELYETSKEVSRELLAVMKPGEALGSESNHLAGLAFYTGKFPVDMDKHHIGVQFLNSKSRVWAVIKEKNHKQMYDPVVNRDYVKPSYMVYRVGKRAIVTNEVPEDGRFLVERVRLQ